jgi:uncharacterized membrane protein YgcG
MKNRSFHRISLGTTAFCLALLSTCVLFAQPPGRGGRGGGFGAGPGGFGGFGGRGGFGMQGGELGAMQLMGLLRMEEVRREIDLDDEVYEAISGRQTMDWRAMRDMSEDERKKALAEADTAAQEMMEEVLEPAQQKRLMGLLAQQQGVMAAMNKMVAEQIGLDDKDLKELRKGMESVTEELSKKREALREKMMSMFAGRRGGEGGQRERPDASAREELMKASQELAKESTEMTEAKFKELQPEAFKKLEELKGEKFEFPRRQFGQGGRGGEGGGRGRGGRGGDGGGRGGRGGSDT